MELYLDGIIAPIAKWDVGNRDYLLWTPNAVHKISATIKTNGFVNFVIYRCRKIEYFSARMIVVMKVKNTNI